MKIAWIRFPEALYESRKIIRGGSEIANQQIIDYLRTKGVDIREFAPESKERLDLVSIPVLGTTLMFQDLIKKTDEINSCDLVVTNHWFGSIIPEITVPMVTIFHHDAKLVIRHLQIKVKGKKTVFNKWIKILNLFSLGKKTYQDLHEQIISIGEERLSKMSTMNIAVSNFLKDELARDYPIATEKISVIYNNYPSDWEKSCQYKKLPKASAKLKLICVTRLPIDEIGIIIKGIDRILEIFERENSCEKTIVATTIHGAYQKFFKKRFPQISFNENIERKKVGQKLLESQISIHASRCESFGLTVTESMLMGNVPVAFPTGIVEELIENGRNGFIVETVEEALEKIGQLVQNKQLLEEMSKNAQKTVLNKMSPGKIGELYKTLFEKITEDR